MLKTTLIAGFVTVATSVAVFAQTAPAPTAPAKAPAAVTAPATSTTTAPAAKPDDGARNKFRQACGADMTKLCGDIKPVANATPEQMKETRTKMRACLTTNTAKLSTECKSAMSDRETAAAAKKS